MLAWVWAPSTDGGTEFNPAIGRQPAGLVPSRFPIALLVNGGSDRPAGAFG
jgi:hypothetical protein